MKCKKENLIFLASIAIIIAACFSLYELHGFLSKVLRRHDFILNILDFVLYAIFFFAFCAIGPVSSWLNSRFNALYLSDKYGEEWSILSDEEMAMIDIILAEKRLPKEYGALPEIHEEARIRVKEKNHMR